MKSFNPLPSHEGRHDSHDPAEAEESFNPLPSHEGRRKPVTVRDVDEDFQSTSLSRGKTDRVYEIYRFCGLSIHFPLTREDNGKNRIYVNDYLSIHFPLTREDILECANIYILLPFNPLPSHEGRHRNIARRNICEALSIHFPLTREDLVDL